MKTVIDAPVHERSALQPVNAVPKPGSSAGLDKEFRGLRLDDWRLLVCPLHRSLPHKYFLKLAAVMLTDTPSKAAQGSNTSMGLMLIGSAK